MPLERCPHPHVAVTSDSEHTEQSNAERPDTPYRPVARKVSRIVLSGPLANRLPSREGFKQGVLFVSDFCADGFGSQGGHRIHPLKSTSSHTGTKSYCAALWLTGLPQATGFSASSHIATLVALRHPFGGDVSVQLPVPKAPLFAKHGSDTDSRNQPCSPYSSRSSSTQR